MHKLPIQDLLPEIASKLETENRLLLEAPPGAGKTTLVPLSLLDASWMQKRQIIILEPRRLATRNAAMRMAELLHEPVGETVGYQIRSERCLSAKTKILVVTEGILTRMLQSDPALENVALLIFDEFHERNLHGDLALALSLQSQTLLRDDLKIMVMSATLNTDAIAKLLEYPPLVSSQGKSYPVQQHYLDTKTAHPSPHDIHKLMSKVIKEVLQKDSGSILAFLPGVKEIKKVEKTLRETVDKEIIIAPLYGDMDSASQQSAIAKTDQRKVVLATNIAESSLTIDGVSVVVDSGLQRHSIFNSGSGMNRLQTAFITQDAATQRSGRAGRQGPGQAYRLWHRHRPLTQHATAEILNSDLCSLVLELANWGVSDVAELQWIDLPPKHAVEHAKRLLHQLGALQQEKITAHGQQMSKLGVHPRLAHMMLKANHLGYGKLAALLAALLSEKEILLAPHKESVDLLERLEAVLHRTSKSHLNNAAFYRVKQRAREFEKKLPNTDKGCTYNSDIPALLLAFAYPDRIAKRRGLHETRYLLANGKGATLPKEDGLFNTQFLVVSNLDASQKDARIFSALALNEQHLHEAFSSQIIIKKEVCWSEEREAVEAREHTVLGAITLEEKHSNDITADEIVLALSMAVKERGLDVLPWSKEAKNLQQRAVFLYYWGQKEPLLTEQTASFPDLSEATLLETLEQWLTPHLHGINNFKALQKLNLQPILLGLLTWEQQNLLNTMAPLKLKVPSGSNIFIDYNDPKTPLLSVRLQELFGMTETPRVLDNRLSLTIELLSPAMRPMQVTKDLKSFWDNTYDEVKKELRGKYKKHYWPDDPYSAIATSKTKKQM